MAFYHTTFHLFIFQEKQILCFSICFHTDCFCNQPAGQSYLAIQLPVSEEFPQ